MEMREIAEGTHRSEVDPLREDYGEHPRSEELTR